MVDPPANAWRRRLMIAGAALPVSCAAPTPGIAPPPIPPPLPEPQLGQRWRYETTDQFRGQAIGELRAEVIRNDPAPRLPAGRPRPAGHVAPLVVALTDSRGASMGEEQWSGAWDILLEPAYDTPQTFDSPMPLLPDRLEPGFRRTDTTWYRVSASPDALWWQQRLSAVRWERVSVPAGDFDALRIERFINFRHWDRWREYPWRTDTIWYAPTVGRWVQREWTGRYRWPGRRPVEASEDWVRWRLLEWQPGASRISAPSR